MSTTLFPWRTPTNRVAGPGQLSGKRGQESGRMAATQRIVLVRIRSGLDHGEADLGINGYATGGRSA